jgi:stromal membrane-associated protein
MSRSKDASSKLHEKHQAILADLLRDEDNKYCADCLSKGEFDREWLTLVVVCMCLFCVSSEK